MYISKVRIQNFRCFKDCTIEFNDGLNVLIGSNNAGKTTVIKALELVFKRGTTKSNSVDDFYKGVDLSTPPEVNITATLRSSKTDTVDDKAIVASWLTKLESPWEAELTYRFFLPEQYHASYLEEYDKTSNQKERWRLVERTLKRYVSRIYGGNIVNNIRAEADYLDKIHCETLDALRDVESKLSTGKNSLLRQLLEYFKDNHTESTDTNTGNDDDFAEHSEILVRNLIGRVNQKEILDFAEKTGASVGGVPTLDGSLEESDVLSTLRLIVKDQTGIEIPIVNNGMGYNNLIYISMILSKFTVITSNDYGDNAKTFPILLIEEPEAHLHPALQYNFLKFLKEEVTRQNVSRQIFITTHSTQITSAVGLDPIICLERSDGSQPTPKYPGRVFSDEDQQSKKYVERFLDATKSAMLFATSVLLVEGMAELILLPVLAERIDCDLDKHHVSLVRVDALTFKHFIKLFGAGVKPEYQQYALEKRVGCIVDTDPMKKRTDREDGKMRRWEQCWPFEIRNDNTSYEYKGRSSAIENLLLQTGERSNVGIYFKGERGKTFEYDLAWENPSNELLFTKEVEITEVDELNDCDWEQEDKEKAKYASSFLLYAEGRKGELAFDLASRMKERTAIEVKVPVHICKALEWVCHKDSSTGDNHE
ncbi:DNA replication and repair protein RecF [Alicyclobacillus hesperidum URH17-3-68]|uniref:Putative ATP-dependent endonuclease of the OLD family n=1 Tax=Alicyclobacillus tolerans TaxID=90970 RepID=A0A1M6TM66_9BACL|nr:MULTISPECIES: AAA family ATPase [Alicyclobacillus]EJY56048.1 DNA replication and repair protein RecF [Alicyclobacillus hesperidum URH17-3-68]SHK58051.1 putative ATP-dependent endonuclease of the OLD family [Alicyclobacillus montanus]